VGLRIGLGYDVHPFAPDRELYLGGVRLDHPRGLAGHSDGDALVHSIADALLGALALGDLGQHFSDQDEKWRNARSTEILGRVVEMLAARRARVLNVDATILADEPRIAPHRERMRARIAEVLGIEIDRVSVKATRTEGVGELAGGAGVAVHSVALIWVKEDEDSE
jgi:2-C-methyl-D-erythritol 2,4-cyclodiphosphate synthase